MLCPLCRTVLPPGTFEVAEHRSFTFTCPKCDEFFGRMNLNSSPEKVVFKH